MVFFLCGCGVLTVTSLIAYLEGKKGDAFFLAFLLALALMVWGATHG